jgi:hypothetical protein
MRKEAQVERRTSTLPSCLMCFSSSEDAVEEESMRKRFSLTFEAPAKLKLWQLRVA